MESLCTLRHRCRQRSRNTRFQVGAAPYLGRTYMRRPLSRTFFGLAKKVLRGDGDSAALMARQTPTAGRSRWSSPVAVRGAPKAQGLMNGSVPADHETVSLSHVCHLVFACGGVNPRLEPIARVRPLVAQTLARLATRPLATGSIATAKTIGMTDVACLTVGTALPTVTMTSTFSRTNSAAISA